MITKKDIEFSLNYWKNLGKLSPVDLQDIRILTPEEYAAKAGCTVRYAHEIHGRFNWLITHISFSTYLGIESDLEKEDVDELVYNFLKENALI